jgi:DNA-binding MarR family transcriptional regulator
VQTEIAFRYRLVSEPFGDMVRAATEPRRTTIASQLESNGTVNLGPLDELVGYHLRRASAAVGSDYFRSVEPGGMRQVLFGVLSVISANPGINQGNVGRALGIQRPNMVALVNELTGHGWVERSVDTVDRRAFVLNLTPAGEAAVANVLALIRVHEERMVKDLNAQERRTLIRLLSRIEAKGD